MTTQNNQEIFLMNLLDFSNLPSKRQQTGKFKNNNHININDEIDKSPRTNTALSNYNRSCSSNIGNFAGNFLGNVQNHIPATSNPPQHHSHQKQLLNQFSNLREKLNHSQRENITLQSENQQLTKQIEKQRAQNTKLASRYQTVKKQNTSLQVQCKQYKQRLLSLKQNNQKIQQDYQQLQFLQMKINQLQSQIATLKKENSKAMELSIEEKLYLQDQIQVLKLRQIEFKKTVQEVENAQYQKNKEFIHLENQYKKLKMLYDEEIYSKKFTGEKEVLVRDNQEMKRKLDELDDRYRKQKNKKYQLEQKLLELEEKVRLYGTKTDIYQGELLTMNKRMKKVQKQQSDAKSIAHTALHERLSWEEKFYNSTILCQQMITRAKRELMGDIVQLAKSCQFKLNKLKNDEKVDITANCNFKRSSSSESKLLNSRKKLRSKTISHAFNSTAKKQQRSNTKQAKANNVSNFQQSNSVESQAEPSSTLPMFKSSSSQYNHSQQTGFPKAILKQASNSSQHQLGQGIKKNLFGQQNESAIQTVLKKTLTSTPMQDENIQAKIRKERQAMQKKLRQKILYHRIDDTTNQETKNRLRDEYLSMAALEI